MKTTWAEMNEKGVDNLNSQEDPLKNLPLNLTTPKTTLNPKTLSAPNNTTFNKVSRFFPLIISTLKTLKLRGR